MGTFTFESSGITVRLRAVAPLLAQRVVASFPPPEPPMVRVTVGDTEMLEPNPADPAHAQALARHNQRVNERILDTCILFGVVDDLDLDARAAVAAMRRSLRAVGLDAVDEDDRLIYIKYVAILDPQEGGAFVAAVLQAPSEAAVQRHAAAFRGPVPGA